MTSKPKIQCNIITGALGSGKTSTIQAFIAQRPPGEKWAVLVNEIGALGLDEALLQGGPSPAGSSSSSSDTKQEPVTIRQLAGGCMCCTLSGPLAAAIAQTIRQARPNRLIIEPSGLGHPGGLIDVLRSEHLAPVLEISSILCCIDLGRFTPELAASNPLFSDQVSAADVLIGTKPDTASTQQAEDFKRWASGDLYPPKLRVEVCCSSAAPLSLLDSVRENSERTFDFRAPHSAVSDQPSTSESESVQVLKVGDGFSGLGGATRHVSPYACGWLVPPGVIIPKTRIESFVAKACGEYGAVRAKGVFRSMQRTWLAFNHVASGSNGGAPNFSETAYRRDNRLEIIFETSPVPPAAIEALEALLLAGA